MSVKYYGTEKIGEEFEYRGKEYRVLPEDCSRCDCCDIKSIDGACHEMACMPFQREDKRNVFYCRIGK